MVVCDGWSDEVGRYSFAIGWVPSDAGGGLVEVEISFLDGPAVVAAFLDDVDFLDLHLANVTDDEVTGLAVEAHAPGVALTPCIDFIDAFSADAGVVRGDGVLAIGGFLAFFG